LIAAGCATHPPPAATPRAPAPSATSFVATAYCHSATTAAGVKARPGIVAADPAVLPLGSVIRVERTGGYDGTYTVMDTGSKLQGRRVDLFIDSCAAAKRFGRRTVLVHVVDAARR
jgi:3D (Asp-Asp-Asp) domain-containing protein